MSRFEIRHLQHTFRLTDVSILQERADGSLVLACRQGYFSVNKAGRRVGFDGERAELEPLEGYRDGEGEDGLAVAVAFQRALL